MQRLHGVRLPVERVVDLQLQLRGEVPQIDAGGADELAVSDELSASPRRPCRCQRSSWPAQKIFARFSTHRPQNEQPALGRRAAPGQVRCVPRGQVRFASAVPPVPVPRTQPVPGVRRVTAAVHRAGSQRPAAPDRRARVREEVFHRRAALLAEPDGVCVAQPSPDRHRRPVAVPDRALVSNEHGVVRGGYVGCWVPEFRPDNGHGLNRRPRSASHLPGGGHSCTSWPVNQPAASSV